MTVGVAPPTAAPWPAPGAAAPPTITAPRPAPAPDQHWNLLVACVAVNLLCAVGRIHQLFAGLSPLHLALVSGALAGGLILLTPAGTRGLGRAFNLRPTMWLLILTLWVLLSIPGALWPGGAVALLVGVFLKLVLLYLLLVGCVRGVRDIERLSFIYYTGAAVYAVIVLTRFRTGGSADRLGGLIYYDANDFAALAVTALPLGLYFLVGRQPWWRRATAMGGSVALAIAFVWAGSRGGFIALFVTGLYVLFRFTAVRASRRWLAAGVVILLLATAGSDTFWERMQSITAPEDDYNVTAEGGRVQVWKRGIGYMLSHPVFGVGADNFPTAEGTLSPLARRQARGRGLKWSAAHNTFVQIGAELGIPGLVAFVAMLIATFGALRRSQPRALAQALNASLIGFIAGAMFLSFAYREILYAILGLAVGLRAVGLNYTAAGVPAARR